MNRVKVCIGMCGENSSRWKGELAKKNAIHMYLKRHYLMPEYCEICGERKKLYLSYKHHPQPYTRDIKDYQWVCARCHMIFDGRLQMFKGRRHTEETKRKMSLNNKRTMLGKHQSEEARRKMSIAHKGKPSHRKGKHGMLSQETLRKMSEAQTGRKHSEETKQKMRETQRKRFGGVYNERC